MSTTHAIAPRLDIQTVAPKAVASLIRLGESAEIDPVIAELVKLRASQINGCAYCIDMHSKDARLMGETEQRLYGLSAWRETPYYSDAERAALAMTEAGTLLHEDGIPDEVWDEAARHFDEEHMAGLLLMIATINSWNRIAVGTRAPVGTYEPA